MNARRTAERPRASPAAPAHSAPASRVGAPNAGARAELAFRPGVGAARERSYFRSVASSAERPVPAAVESEVRGLRGGGVQLPATTRADLEAQLGRDLSAVRLHTGPRAEQLARALRARAFAFEREIVLGRGEGDPATPGGRRLLAHEIAHVAQQERIGARIQRVVIDQEFETPYPCGRYYAGFDFHLVRPAPEDGYFVQKIERSEWVRGCGDSGAPPPQPDYWEAWPVARGARRTDDGGSQLPTDLSGLDTPHPETVGEIHSVGTVKFYPKSITGDLDTLWTIPRRGCDYGPPRGLVPESGAAPSTPAKPAFWDQRPIGPPARRTVTVSWDCCGGEGAAPPEDSKLVVEIDNPGDRGDQPGAQPGAQPGIQPGIQPRPTPE